MNAGVQVQKFRIQNFQKFRSFTHVLSSPLLLFLSICNTVFLGVEVSGAIIVV